MERVYLVLIQTFKVLRRRWYMNITKETQTRGDGTRGQCPKNIHVAHPAFSIISPAHRGFFCPFASDLGSTQVLAIYPYFDTPNTDYNREKETDWVSIMSQNMVARYRKEVYIRESIW